jgi:hypothetical protein
MSLERRVARLEARPPAAAPVVSIEARVDAGTASISDYAAFHQDYIAEQQDDFLARTPFMLAITHSNIRHRNTPDFALAYPPDRPLPAGIQEHFDEFVETIEFDIDEGLRNGWNGKSTAEEYRRGCAGWRGGSAAVLLACGGYDGMALRRRIWMVEDDHWVLVPDVWAAAKRCGDRVWIADRYRNVPGLYTARMTGQIGDPAASEDWVSYADAAHFVGVPVMPVLDDAVVKSGQNWSGDPRRPSPASLPELEVSTSIAGIPRRIAPGQTP